LLAQNHTRNLTPKQVEYAGIIHSAGSDLLQLINDILDLSKVEAGKMDLNPEQVPMRQLLDYIEATFRPMTTQKSLGFTITAAPGVPSELFTDDSRLRQVLRNLISNAIKFTERGSVQLRIESADSGELPVPARGGGPVVAFRVEDTGIGIAPQQLDSIFGAFQQSDGTTSRKYGGTGLGLSISREMAHLLGGAIEAKSAPGAGSTFTLYLPAVSPDLSSNAREIGATGPAGSAGSADSETPPERRQSPAAAQATLRQPRRLLVIEDRHNGLLSLVAESAVSSLEGGGTGLSDRHVHEVTTVIGAREAATALASEAFHCVVVDVEMANDAAWTFLGAMDGDPALRQVPVLVHNSQPLSARQEGALQTQAAERPLEVLSSLDELRERIALHLSAEQPGDVVPLVRADAALRPAVETVDDGLSGRTVLVVDDDARNLYAISGILEMHGIHVVHATDGRKGIETLSAHGGIDLILMDVMMPEMDGYAATAEIRRMPEYAELPIIAVTAKAMPGDRDKSLAAGASDYVTKPVDANDLIACIRRWLDERIAPLPTAS